MRSSSTFLSTGKVISEVWEYTLVAHLDVDDLVGDLVEPKFSGFDGMRYVVCMKSFKSSETGEKQGTGLGCNGHLDLRR